MSYEADRPEFLADLPRSRSLCSKFSYVDPFLIIDSVPEVYGNLLNLGSSVLP